MREGLNEWVPTAAFIEYFVLNEAIEKDVSIEVASRSVLPKFGLTSEEAFLHVETRLLAMAYTLLVFPREVWRRQGLLDMVIERAKADADLATSNHNALSLEFIRSIRNAVSHARIHFSGPNVTFQDGKLADQPSFDVTMPIADVVNLLLVLGRAFHKCAQIKL